MAGSKGTRPSRRKKTSSPPPSPSPEATPATPEDDCVQFPEDVVPTPTTALEMRTAREVSQKEENLVKKFVKSTFRLFQSGKKKEKPAKSSLPIEAAKTPPETPSRQTLVRRAFEDEGDGEYFNCLTCKVTPARIRCKNRCYDNLDLHLAKVHPTLYQAILHLATSTATVYHSLKKIIGG